MSQAKNITNQLSTNVKSCQVDKKQPAKYQPSVYEIVHYEAKSFIQQMAYMLIRPPRFCYNKFLITPNKKVQNFTLQIHTLPDFQLSLYLPVSQNPHYVILYLHGNSSSRLEGFLNLNLLPQNVGMACFDFAGCGNRYSSNNKDAVQFLTLGKKQSKQVDIAARYLKSLGYKVLGWGRSMGSVSLLLSSEIEIMIVDSPYESLLKLCIQSQQKVVPWYLKCLVPCFSNCIFDRVKQKVFQLSGMRIEEMQISQKINKNAQHRQICFIHGQNDDLISFKHSQALYQKFQGRKQYILFQGTHNSNRNQDVINCCLDFLQESFQAIELKQVQNKSKLLFVRENRQRKGQDKKLQILNSLKKNKKKIYLPKLEKNNSSKKEQTNVGDELNEKDQIKLQFIEANQRNKMDGERIEEEQYESSRKLQGQKAYSDHQQMQIAKSLQPSKQQCAQSKPVFHKELTGAQQQLPSAVPKNQNQKKQAFPQQS